MKDSSVEPTAAGTATTAGTSAADTSATAPSPRTVALIDELDQVVFRLARLMTAKHENGSMDLTGPQYLVLKLLSERGPATISELGTMLGVKAPAASAMVDRLEKAGCVEREHDAEDRRVIRVSVAKAGRESVKHSETMRREHMIRHLTVLTEDELQQLVSIIRKVTDAL
jgi:DNA-binding MarR family transcriptional regulator